MIQWYRKVGQQSMSQNFKPADPVSGEIPALWGGQIP